MRRSTRRNICLDVIWRCIVITATEIWSVHTVKRPSAGLTISKFTSNVILDKRTKSAPSVAKVSKKVNSIHFSLQISGFVCKSDLIRHKLNVHSAYGRYQCPDCGKRLRSNTSLNRHRQSRLCIKQLFPGTYADNEVRLSWVSYIVLTSFNHILQTLILNSVRHSIHLWRQSARLVKWVRAAPEAAAWVAAGASGRDGVRRIANTANLPTPSDSWNTICNNFEWESGRAE